MAEIILAEYLGFCYGVKRAINLARTNAQSLTGKKASTLGPIIHNPQMVARLAEEGVGCVNSLDEVQDNETVIIRSHGVEPEIYQEIQKRHLNLVDATCPHVKRAQIAAYELSKTCDFVIIIGEKKHPEVKSILGWAMSSKKDNRVKIIETLKEAEALPQMGKVGVVSQTTFSDEDFRSIINVLLTKTNDMHVVRTICTATKQRQTAALELASQVDLMLVIGGRNSANTTRLAELCATKTKTIHLETADELKEEWFSDKTIKKIGMTAGASTPDWIIREVYSKWKTWKWEHCSTK